MNGVITRTLELSADIERVWKALRDLNELAKWPQDFERFLRIFEPLAEVYRKRTRHFGTYFTGRYTGGPTGLCSRRATSATFSSSTST